MLSASSCGHFIVARTCESKVACKISAFCSKSCFWMFNWWFQKLGELEPTPDRLALTFEFVRSQKDSFYDEKHEEKHIWRTCDANVTHIWRTVDAHLTHISRISCRKNDYKWHLRLPWFYTETMIQRYSDTTIQRHNDTTIQRYNDTAIQRIHT